MVDHSNSQLKEKKKPSVNIVKEEAVVNEAIDKNTFNKELGSKFINSLDYSRIGSVKPETLDKIFGSKAYKELPEEDKKILGTFIKIKKASDVHENIILGSNRDDAIDFKGIVQYESDLDSYLAIENKDGANKELERFETWVGKFQDKAKRAKDALDKSVLTKQAEPFTKIDKTDGYAWVEKAESKALIEQIQEEANTLEQALELFKLKYKKTFPDAQEGTPEAQEATVTPAPIVTPTPETKTSPKASSTVKKLTELISNLFPNSDFVNKIKVFKTVQEAFTAANVTENDPRTLTSQKSDRLGFKGDNVKEQWFQFYENDFPKDFLAKVLTLSKKDKNASDKMLY